MLELMIMIMEGGITRDTAALMEIMIETTPTRIIKTSEVRHEGVGAAKTTEEGIMIILTPILERYRK